MELKDFLPLDLYGKGNAKDFESLQKEIDNGESTIIWENEIPIRLIRVARVKVISLEKELRLFEDRQEFADGRVRYRGIDGLAEKFLSGEKLEDTAARALKEELGLSEEAIALTPIHFDGTDSEEKESPSYPGLVTRYEFHDFLVYFPIEFWQEEFVERSDDDIKKTYFVWR